MEITGLLRSNFSFRFIVIEDEEKRIGEEGLEGYLIGTVARCELCKPSNKWLGRYHPNRKIRKSGLWLVRHVNHDPISEADKKVILDAIDKTLNWLSNHSYRQG